MFYKGKIHQSKPRNKEEREKRMIVIKVLGVSIWRYRRDHLPHKSILGWF